MADMEKLTSADLEAQVGEPLPDREAMSAVHVGIGNGIDNFAMPINEAIAINNDSTSSYAIADADQIVIIDQTDVT